MLEYFSLIHLGKNNLPAESTVAAMTLLNGKLQFFKLSQFEVLNFLNLKKDNPLIFELDKEKLVFRVKNKQANSYNYKFIFIFENNKVDIVKSEYQKNII